MNPQGGEALFTLVDGAVFCESDFDRDIRIRATATGSHESLVFTITGAVNQSNLENHVTYDSHQFWANPGTYTITAELYSDADAGGNLCDTRTVTFTVEECQYKGEEESGLTLDPIQEIQIYPNPASGSVIITLQQDLSANDVVKVYTLTGRQVDQISFTDTSNRLQIDLSDYNAGIYMLSIESAEFGRIAKRFIVK